MDTTRDDGLTAIRRVAANLSALAVVTHGVARNRQEAARQHALWNLVFTLHRAGVSDVHLEARERRQNEKDTATMRSIFKVPGLAGGRHSFGRPNDEPLLWLADYVAGALGEALTSGDQRRLGRLPQGMIERLDLRAP